jgi:sigma-E factor negative regulatory protein RseA
MSTKSEDLGQGAADDLSALVDGELASSDVGRACARWRSDPEARATWHAYQLIGDVLRSDDLASAPGHDSGFLATFRQRMAQEPVVLAPTPVAPAAVPRPVAPRRSLRTSVAIAAGFAAVAGVLVVTQVPRSMEPSAIASVDFPAVVQDAGTAVRPVVVAGAAIAASPAAAGIDRHPTEAEAAMVLDGQFIRDARLDEYLAAHKKFGGSSAPGGPSGFLRNATAGGR